MFLYHYFEKERGPFLVLPDLPNEEVQRLINQCRLEDKASGRKTLMGSVYNDDNIVMRRRQEYMARKTFIEKGGKPIRQHPYYMVLARVDDISYKEGLKNRYNNGEHVRISVEEFDMTSVSFTYGDQSETVDPRDEAYKKV